MVKATATFGGASAGPVELPRPLAIQPEEKEAARPARPMTIIEWAESRYILPSETAELAGLWSCEIVPYLREVLEALSDTGTRRVTLKKCSQCGATESCNILIGRTVDEAPAPTLMVMPREDDVRRRVRTRLRPMFRSTPSLLARLGGDIDGLNIGTETVLDRMILYLGWATSPAALADNPVCIVILDEVGKFPPKVAKEADPVSLATKRQRTFRSRSKLYDLSTPVYAGDLIDREYNQGDRREWWSRCPHCGKSFVIEWRHVELDKGADGGLLDKEDYRAGGGARIRCEHCQKPWSERDRWRAVSDGRWAPDGCRVDGRGRIVGKVKATTHRSYHVCAMMLHPMFVTIDELAAEFAAARLEQKAGDPGPMQDFINSQLGDPWMETVKVIPADRLLSHVGSTPMGLVPDGVQLLVAGVDVQIDHFWVMVVGYGYMSQRWVIHAGRLESGDTRYLDSYDILRAFLTTTWPMESDPKKYHTLRVAGVDRRYRGDVVEDFCRQCRDVAVVPVMGDDAVRGVIYRPKKLAHGQVRYDLNLGALKDRIQAGLTSDEAGPGYIHLPADIGADVLGHLVGEVQIHIRRGRKLEPRWVPKTSRTPVHTWDCFVYAEGVAEVAGARLLRDPNAPVVSVKRRVGKMERMKR